MFLNTKRNTLLINAPCTRIVVFWHIGNRYPQWFRRVKFVVIPPRFFIAATFVKYCFTTGQWVVCHPVQRAPVTWREWGLWSWANLRCSEAAHRQGENLCEMGLYDKLMFTSGTAFADIRISGIIPWEIIFWYWEIINFSVSGIDFSSLHREITLAKSELCFRLVVRRAGLLLSQQDFEWRWSVPLFQCLTVLEFSFILFDLCLLITFFNFIMNYVPIVTFWIFTYHKIWILSIMFCFIWSYWIIYFLACL